MDGDGRDDILVEGSAGTSLILATDLLNNCTFPQTVQSVAAYRFLGTGAFAAGDVDGDDVPDLGFDQGDDALVLGRDVLTLTPFGANSVVNLASEASFVFNYLPGLAGAATLAAAGDVDGDGKDDLIASFSTSISAALIPGASLTTPLVSSAVVVDQDDVIQIVCDDGAFSTCGGGWIGMGDVDSDGLADIRAELFDQGGVAVPIRRLSGSALASLSVGGTVNISSLGDLPGPCLNSASSTERRASVGDVDGDGLPDIAGIDTLVLGSRIAAAPAGTALTCDDNDLDARFTPNKTFFNSISLGDVDGDGRDDLVDGRGGDGVSLSGRVRVFFSPY